MRLVSSQGYRQWMLKVTSKLLSFGCQNAGFNPRALLSPLCSPKIRSPLLILHSSLGPGTAVTYSDLRPPLPPILQGWILYFGLVFPPLPPTCLSWPLPRLNPKYQAKALPIPDRVVFTLASLPFAPPPSATCCPGISEATSGLQGSCSPAQA